MRHRSTGEPCAKNEQQYSITQHKLLSSNAPREKNVFLIDYKVSVQLIHTGAGRIVLPFRCPRVLLLCASQYPSTITNCLFVHNIIKLREHHDGLVLHQLHLLLLCPLSHIRFSLKVVLLRYVPRVSMLGLDFLETFAPHLASEALNSQLTIRLTSHSAHFAYRFPFVDHHSGITQPEIVVSLVDLHHRSRRFPLVKVREELLVFSVFGESSADDPSAQWALTVSILETLSMKTAIAV